MELYNVSRDYNSGVEACDQDCDWRDERMHIPQSAPTTAMPKLEVHCGFGFRTTWLGYQALTPLIRSSRKRHANRPTALTAIESSLPSKTLW